MRYNLDTKFGRNIGSVEARKSQSTLGKKRIKREKHQDRNFLVREFSLNRLIANSRKARFSSD
jgi:hypothetical protein